MEAEVFARKPVSVEAYFLTRESYHAILNWSNGKVRQAPTNKRQYAVETLEGVYYVDYDTHWIVKGVKGEFYPVEKEIFETIYDGDFDCAYKTYSNDRIKFGER